MRQQTRRAFLRKAGRASLAAGALAAFGPRLGLDQVSADERGLQIEVLIGELTHRRGDTFAAWMRDGGAEWHESPVLQTSFPFTHAGLHWLGDVLKRVELRTSADGQSWAPWTKLAVESRPAENPRGEWFAALLGAERARFAQYRVGGDEPMPDRVTLTYLNSLDGARRPVGEAPHGFGRLSLGSTVAHADAGDFRTGVITREQWGADESLRFTVGGEEVWPRAYVAPRVVVVHHTATRNHPDDSAAEVRAIYAYHAVTLGWGDIGYNALLDWEGRIYEGRRGRQTDPFGRLPRDVLSFGLVAAHTFSYNYGSVGHALLGNFQEAEPPPAMLRRIEDLLVFEHQRYQIDPRAALDFARETRLWRYKLPTMPGHRDCVNTECPGDNVYKRLGELRLRVAERIGVGPPLKAIVEAPEPRNPWLGPAVYQWAGAEPYDCVFEGFWRDRQEDTFSYLRGYVGPQMPEHIVTDQTRVTFALREPGQYTLHLRASDQAFADRYTILADRHVVRDNADFDGVERVGAWSTSHNVQEFNGSDYEFAPADSGARFTWSLQVPANGRYAVQACWASAPDRATDAPYRVARSGSALATVRVDQRINGGVWVELGTFDFAAGETCSVTLAAEASGEVVIADAVRLLLLS